MRTHRTPAGHSTVRTARQREPSWPRQRGLTRAVCPYQKQRCCATWSAPRTFGVIFKALRSANSPRKAEHKFSTPKVILILLNLQPQEFPITDIGAIGDGFATPFVRCPPHVASLSRFASGLNIGNEVGAEFDGVGPVPHRARGGTVRMDGADGRRARPPGRA